MAVDDSTEGNFCVQGVNGHLQCTTETDEIADCTLGFNNLSLYLSTRTLKHQFKFMKIFFLFKRKILDGQTTRRQS